jgi:hypothetical protein
MGEQLELGWHPTLHRATDGVPIAVTDGYGVPGDSIRCSRA